MVTRLSDTQHTVIQSLSKEDWDIILQRIMASYNDISKSINPKGLLEINLTSAQIKLLACFSEREELTMTELSRSLGVSMPTMTAMVDRLVNSRMVKRERDTIDRRVVRAMLSEQGRKVLKKLIRIRRNEMEKILVNLSEEEMREFITSMEMVARLLAKARHKRDMEKGV